MIEDKSSINQAQIDKLYEWIKKVICSCDDIVHIHPCGELIDIFEKRNPPKYLVNGLRELLKVYESSVISSKKKSDVISDEDKIYEMFNSGHSPREISNMTSKKYHAILHIINKKQKYIDKKSSTGESR